MRLRDSDREFAGIGPDKCGKTRDLFGFVVWIENFTILKIIINQLFSK